MARRFDNETVLPPVPEAVKRSIKYVESLPPKEARIVFLNHVAASEAHMEGDSAFLDGKPRSANPYEAPAKRKSAILFRRAEKAGKYGISSPIESLLEMEWDSGWEAAWQERRLGGLAWEKVRREGGPRCARCRQTGRITSFVCDGDTATRACVLHPRSLLCKACARGR